MMCFVSSRSVLVYLSLVRDKDAELSAARPVREPKDCRKEFLCLSTGYLAVNALLTESQILSLYSNKLLSNLILDG